MNHLQFYKFHALHHSGLSVIEHGTADLSESSWVELLHKHSTKKAYMLTNKKKFGIQVGDSFDFAVACCSLLGC